MARGIGVKVRNGCGLPPSRYSERVVAEGRVGIRLIDDDAFHQAGECGDDRAPSRCLHLGEECGLHLQIPGVVRLPVSSTARAAETASPPPVRTTRSKYGAGPQ